MFNGVMNLNYKDYCWINNNAAKNGFNPLKFYSEDSKFFILRFKYENVWYKCVVTKKSIPKLISRFDSQKRESVINTPLMDIAELQNNEIFVLKSVDKFRSEELFDYMKVVSFE